mmetsp:Transcript_6701/g.19622  ORF Transcript_6701/g.19622 Transcript_6701/m.19622 type:complete len:233 (-) Transcript_6701:318-1016(-)
MTSRPLFMRVAESMVIFLPMSQLGCFKASETLAVFSLSTSQSLNAPPEAVRMILLSPPSGSPWMHWNSALCSLSAGRMWIPCSLARGRTKGPPAIRVSLFARQMSLPALIAATVGWRPAHPTMPVTVASTEGKAATSHIPSTPAAISGTYPPSSDLIDPKASLSSPTLVSLIDTSSGLNSLIWSRRSSTLLPALKAFTSKLSGCSRQMSSVCVPMEPVQPRMDIGFGVVLFA